MCHEGLYTYTRNGHKELPYSEQQFVDNTHMEQRTHSVVPFQPILCVLFHMGFEPQYLGESGMANALIFMLSMQTNLLQWEFFVTGD